VYMRCQLLTMSYRSVCWYYFYHYTDTRHMCDVTWPRSQLGWLCDKLCIYFLKQIEKKYVTYALLWSGFDINCVSDGKKLELKLHYMILTVVLSALVQVS
jgi:hypothetical protein